MSELLQSRYETAEYGQDLAPLPPGYRFASPESITSWELIELYSDVYPYMQVSSWYLQDIYDDEANAGNTVDGVAVREEHGSLVGLGLVCYAGLSGDLYDFAVHSGHRGNGIGRAIIDARLAIADQQGVKVLKAEFSPTNSLRSYYLQRGFTDIGPYCMQRVANHAASNANAMPLAA